LLPKETTPSTTVGEELWVFDTEFIMCTNPVVVDGVIYFGCEDGYLYAVE